MRTCTIKFSHSSKVYVYEEMGLSERRFQGDDGVFDSEGTAGLSETSFLLKPPAEAPQAYSTDKFFTQLDDLRKKTENLLADSTTLSTKLDGVRELLGEYEQQRGNMTVKREELKLLRGAEQAREERASHAASFEELDVWLRSWRRGNEVGGEELDAWLKGRAPCTWPWPKTRVPSNGFCVCKNLVENGHYAVQSIILYLVFWSSARPQLR